jgi:hypothetical protein
VINGDYLQKTTPLETLDIIMVSAKSHKYGYVDVIATLVKIRISSFRKVHKKLLSGQVCPVASVSIGDGTFCS